MASVNATSQAASLQAAKQPVKRKHPFRILSERLGSLKTAILSLSFLVIVLAMGTMIEQWYSAPIAQQLIYHSWWFIALLGLLACNIFFAAMKKWPWKKHQTGFLITHVGLLTLLAGGVWNAISGVDAFMILTDAPSFEMAKAVGLPRKSKAITFQDEFNITVFKLDRNGRKDKDYSFPYHPGSFAWGDLDGFKAKTPATLAVLNFLAHPLPRETKVNVKEDVRLQVLGYAPHVRIEPISALENGIPGYPSIKVELQSRDLLHQPSTWLSHAPEFESNQVLGEATLARGATKVDFLGICPKSLLSYFKEGRMISPSKKGYVVVRAGTEEVLIPVDTALNKQIDIGTSGWKATVSRYGPMLAKGAPMEIFPPMAPAIQLDLVSPKGEKSSHMLAGRTHFPAGYYSPEGQLQLQKDPSLPDTWYESNDPRDIFNMKAMRQLQFPINHVLQFVEDDEGTIHYRCLELDEGKLKVESAGSNPPIGQPIDVWKSQGGRFILHEHISRSESKNRILPENHRPGLKSIDLSSAMRCRMTLHRNGKETFKDFWMVEERMNQVRLQLDPNDISTTELFQVGFQHKRLELPFEVECMKAESLVDPGTSRPATYTSYVRLFDATHSPPINGESRIITMNEPMDHRGFKFYQSEFQADIDKEREANTDKVINRTGFTVGYDPGIWLKYLGTLFLGLGIFTMYYMKAYLITGKKRPVKEPALSATS